MNRFVLLYLILTCWISPTSAQSIRFVYHKDYATVQFVKRLLDPNPSKEKEMYFRLKGLDFTTLHFLDSLKLDPLSYNFRYHDYPVGQKMNLSFSRLIEKYILEQTPQKSFRQLAAGIIPEEYIVQYERMLYLFRPIYEELVDRPNQLQIKLALQLLESKKEEYKVEYLLQKISVFYGVKMQDYTVMLYPVLDKQITLGTTYLNIAEVSFPIDAFDPLQVILTAIHEVSHLYYSDMSYALKRSFDNWVLNSNQRTARYANWLLDEVLATASGNGWAYYEMFNKTDHGTWYFSNEYVNTSSKLISSLVFEYIKEGKTIDINFFKQYIERLRGSIGLWVRDWDFLMMYREVRAPEREYLELFDRYFPIVYYRRYMIGNSIADMQLGTTKIFIFSDNYLEEGEELSKQFGIQLDSISDFSEPFFKVLNWGDKTQFIFMYGDAKWVEETLQKQSKWFQYQQKRKKRRR